VAGPASQLGQTAGTEAIVSSTIAGAEWSDRPLPTVESLQHELAAAHQQLMVVHQQLLVANVAMAKSDQQRAAAEASLDVANSRAVQQANDEKNRSQIAEADLLKLRGELRQMASAEHQTPRLEQVSQAGTILPVDVVVPAESAVLILQTCTVGDCARRQLREKTKDHKVAYNPAMHNSGVARGTIHLQSFPVLSMQEEIKWLLNLDTKLLKWQQVLIASCNQFNQAICEIGPKVVERRTTRPFALAELQPQMRTGAILMSANNLNIDDLMIYLNVNPNQLLALVAWSQWQAVTSVTDYTQGLEIWTISRTQEIRIKVLEFKAEFCKSDHVAKADPLRESAPKRASRERRSRSRSPRRGSTQRGKRRSRSRSRDRQRRSRSPQRKKEAFVKGSGSGAPASQLAMRSSHCSHFNMGQMEHMGAKQTPCYIPKKGGKCKHIHHCMTCDKIIDASDVEKHKHPKKEK
jgi:hypothetical protein